MHIFSRKNISKLVLTCLISILLINLLEIFECHNAYAGTKLKKLVAGKTYMLDNESESEITTKKKKIWNTKSYSQYGTIEVNDELISFTVENKWNGGFKGLASELYTDGNYLYYTSPLKYNVDSESVKDGYKTIYRSAKRVLRRLDLSTLDNTEMIPLKELKTNGTYYFYIQYCYAPYLYIGFNNGSDNYCMFVYNIESSTYTKYNGHYSFTGEYNNKIYFYAIKHKSWTNSTYYCASPDLSKKEKLPIKGGASNIVDNTLRFLKASSKRKQYKVYVYNLDNNTCKAITPWTEPEKLDNDFMKKYIGRGYGE